MNSQTQEHDSMLRESIKHFLASYHNGRPDYSSFESIFSRKIQTMLDPPLELTWFYSAITFHAARSSSHSSSPSARILVAKDLLNLLIFCSNLSSAPKRISLLAPVMCELYGIVCGCRKHKISAAGMEVDKLVEDIVGYVMMPTQVYDYGHRDFKCDSVVDCFEDLVRVWTIDRGGGSFSFVENLRVFFPLMTDGIWNEVNGRCGMRDLVGIVLCEVFFLRLYLSFASGVCMADLLKYIRDQTVQTIMGFQNTHFLGEDFLLPIFYCFCFGI
ncbi:methyl-CPG-binding domain protein 02 [Striga asiatica]|uniref:Methyl-CPG-binding domain protein 02 n=1 Tax=Striga asiatica TaxID=4170 RepID=A0A5A7R9E6_STRAF|nr:methyl-CPG-binding domain protein 02 [Striga asiatica]